MKTKIMLLSLVVIFSSQVFAAQVVSKEDHKRITIMFKTENGLQSKRPSGTDESALSEYLKKFTPEQIKNMCSDLNEECSAIRCCQGYICSTKGNENRCKKLVPLNMKCDIQTDVCQQGSCRPSEFMPDKKGETKCLDCLAPGQKASGAKQCCPGSFKHLDKCQLIPVSKHSPSLIEKIFSIVIPSAMAIDVSKVNIPKTINPTLKPSNTSIASKDSSGVENLTCDIDFVKDFYDTMVAENRTSDINTLRFYNAFEVAIDSLHADSLLWKTPAISENLNTIFKRIATTIKGGRETRENDLLNLTRQIKCTCLNYKRANLSATNWETQANMAYYFDPANQCPDTTVPVEQLQEKYQVESGELTKDILVRDAAKQIADLTADAFSSSVNITSDVQKALSIVNAAPWNDTSNIFLHGPVKRSFTEKTGSGWLTAVVTFGATAIYECVKSTGMCSETDNPVQLPDGNRYYPKETNNQRLSDIDNMDTNKARIENWLAATGANINSNQVSVCMFLNTDKDTKATKTILTHNFNCFFLAFKPLTWCNNLRIPAGFCFNKVFASNSDLDQSFDQTTLDTISKYPHDTTLTSSQQATVSYVEAAKDINSNNADYQGYYIADMLVPTNLSSKLNSVLNNKYNTPNHRQNFLLGPNYRSWHTIHIDPFGSSISFPWQGANANPANTTTGTTSAPKLPPATDHNRKQDCDAQLTFGYCDFTSKTNPYHMGYEPGFDTAIKDLIREKTQQRKINLMGEDLEAFVDYARDMHAVFPSIMKDRYFDGNALSVYVQQLSTVAIQEITGSDDKHYKAVTYHQKLKDYIGIEDDASSDYKPEAPTGDTEIDTAADMISDVKGIDLSGSISNFTNSFSEKYKVPSAASASVKSLGDNLLKYAAIKKANKDLEDALNSQLDDATKAKRKAAKDAFSKAFLSYKKNPSYNAGKSSTSGQMLDAALASEAKEDSQRNIKDADKLQNGVQANSPTGGNGLTNNQDSSSIYRTRSSSSGQYLDNSSSSGNSQSSSDSGLMSQLEENKFILDSIRESDLEVTEDDSLFKIITKRYMRTAYPRFLPTRKEE